ncbi:MAG TPA: sigma-54 dependent transcriptional regulator [Candidatus Limnocylindria bacterium]|nr:sigma-54 dependent transcriptional regulator [Candidatus Limnocylindria bacterium]
MADAILVADDEDGVRESLAEVLRDEGFAVETARDGLEALAAIDRQDFSVVISDVRMPGADGLEVLRRVRTLAPQTVVLMMTAHASLETAVEALRQGAADYILKPLLFDEVLAKVRRVIEHRRLAWETQVLRREVERQYPLDTLIGDGPAMQEVAQLIRKVAPTGATVLITGESGTGKEVVARAIHRRSAAAEHIFLPVNCAAIPETLLESQLFGHTRGAFTGAVSSQEGLFARAHGGTIFLDEIGDMPLGLQSKLLRVLESKEILPVGGTTPRTIDVRIIAASNQDLAGMVAAGTFREDLYYRLNVVEIHLPPLRERREDIPALVEHFVRRHNRELKRAYRGVDNASLKLLMSHPWKGNVRELDNVIEHAMILGDGEWITPADLPRPFRQGELAAPAVGDDLREALRVYERIHIETVLRRSAGDKRQAADRLGLSLSSLYRKMNELGIPLE